MAIFDYFGCLYEINGDGKTVSLRGARNVKGKFFIPSQVENQGKTYTVTSIKTRDEWVYEWKIDKRLKDGGSWADTGNREKAGPFTGSLYSETVTANNNVTSVIIPDTIKELSAGAFRKCYALEEVSMPKSVTKIPFRCFSGAKALKYIELHEGIISIEKLAFFNCAALTEITIPSSVKTIDESAFDGNCGLKVVNILNDEGAVIIHPEAFTDRVKINYLGKKGAKKATQAEQKKDATPAKSASIDLEKLIQAALVDGVVTDKERAVLVKKVKEAGGDVDEFEMLLDARIYEAQQKNGKAKSEPAKPKAEPKPAAKVSGDFKKSAVSGGYTIGITADNKVVVNKGGKACDNTKGALREISEKVGFEYDPKWNTQQFGSKLIDFLEK
ncbi:MAG: leucine-rich repeat protein [Bacteroidales bacterium]|nr:leucine-rich repeat protein [Bacteroidales bacterium]